MSNKYDASGSIEGRFEDSSKNTVLANKLGITDLDEITNLELDRLLIAQEQIINSLEENESITCDHLCRWHKFWLGEIYEWAGNYRSVNISKGDFHFAVAHLLPKLMKEFEENYLSKFTSADITNKDEIIEALAITHVEFILIHPFRDGNGRLGRLLMTIMALQAGMPVLNFDPIDKNRESYFLAIQLGLDGNYEAMKNIVSNVLEASKKDY